MDERLKDAAELEVHFLDVLLLELPKVDEDLALDEAARNIYCRR